MERILKNFKTEKEGVAFAVQHFIDTANQAIDDRGQFAVALSGGSTPKAIFQALAKNPDLIDWSRVLLFWSDERSIPPDHQGSNYLMAMDSGLAKLPINPDHIFRMHAEIDIEVNAAAYEHVIKTKTDGIFDLIMLGMGPDGHTASLFPHTEALKVTDRLVTANYIPSQETWRMTLTYPCINAARTVCIYSFGKEKEESFQKTLNGPHDPDSFPIQKIDHLIWISDLAC